jgi:hypothetical protein
LTGFELLVVLWQFRACLTSDSTLLRICFGDQWRDVQGSVSLGEHINVVIYILFAQSRTSHDLRVGI